MFLLYVFLNIYFSVTVDRQESKQGNFFVLGCDKCWGLCGGFRQLYLAEQVVGFFDSAKEKTQKMLFSLLLYFFGIKSCVFMSNIMSVFKLRVNILLEAAKIEFYSLSSALIFKSSL